MAGWVETNVNGYNVYTYDGNNWVSVNKTYAYWGAAQNDWFIYSGTTIRGLTAKYESGSPVYNNMYGYGQADITIPNNCTALTDSAFIRLKNVDTDTESIVIPNDTLQTLYIPDSVISLSNGAIAQCIALSSVRLPNDITKIPAMLFYCQESYNTVLEKVTIPHNVTSFDPYVFAGCKRIKRLDFIRDTSYTGQINIQLDIFDSVITPFEMYFTCSQAEAETLFDFGSSAYYTQQTFTAATKYYNQVITND